jgi:hypothetical protein
MMYFAGGGGVEQSRIGTYLPQDRPVARNFSADLFRDGTPKMASCQDGADDGKLRIDPFVQHTHGVLQVNQRPYLESTGLNDHASVVGGRERGNRQNSQGGRAVEDNRRGLAKISLLQTGLQEVLPSRFCDRLRLTAGQVDATWRNGQVLGKRDHVNSCRRTTTGRRKPDYRQRRPNGAGVRLGWRGCIRRSRPRTLHPRPARHRCHWPAGLRLAAVAS